MKNEEKLDDIGFSKSFIAEMDSDRDVVKRGNRASVLGEITSYLLYGTEVFKNLVFYMFVFSSKNEIEQVYVFSSFYIILAFLSVIFSVIILKNFVKVSKILHGGELPSGDKLFLICIVIYYSYSHGLLNLVFLGRVLSF